MYARLTRGIFSPFGISHHKVHPCRQGGNGSAELRGVEDGRTLRQAPGFRPERVLRRLFLRHPASFHP